MPPWKKYDVADFAPAHDAIEIVERDRIGQARADIVNRCALQHQRRDIALHEDRAAFAQTGRMLGGQRQIGELVLDLDPQLFRLLLQKRTGAGGAGFVHGEIYDHAFFQTDELGILSANLEDGIHRLNAELIANVRGAGLMSRDLVVDGVGPNQFADQFPAAAGGSRHRGY